MKRESLILENVTKQYRAGNVVFKDISTRFEPGESVLLTGPNGSGKTTFLKLLSVNTFPTAGKLFYGDLEIHRKPWRYLKHVGLVHDEESLPQHLSAAELLEWILRSRSMWDDQSADRISRLYDHLELDEARYDLIGTYSTGMRKKTQIAAALICRPPVLILDEPLRGLDTSATARTLELLREETGRGALILMASHEHREATDWFDKVLNFPLS